MKIYKICDWKATLGLCISYQIIWKNLRKMTLVKRNFSKLLNVFLLADLEISFFNRFYLWNGAGWTNLYRQYRNFLSSCHIRGRNFKLRKNKKLQKFSKFSAWKSILGLGISYQIMWKNFRKITNGNRAFLKIMNVFY